MERWVPCQEHHYVLHMDLPERAQVIFALMPQDNAEE